MRGWVMGGYESETRRRVVSADAGQDSFAWPRTRDAASLQLIDRRMVTEGIGAGRFCCDRPRAAEVVLRPCVSLDRSSQLERRIDRE